MDQQVSPAVLVVVLILIVAIVVALYFLVVQATPQVVSTGGVARPAGAKETAEEEAEGEEAEVEPETPVAAEDSESSSTP